MMPEQRLSALTYEQLVGLLLEPRDEIDALQEMTPGDEQEFRKAYSEGGQPPPDDFRSVFILEAGLRQVEIVRECLRRVDLRTLAEDSGYPEVSLMLFASYRGDPPDPEAN